jgi:hypothetical protein
MKISMSFLEIRTEKITNKNCLGIQNLPDDFKQQFKTQFPAPLTAGKSQVSLFFNR